MTRTRDVRYLPLEQATAEPRSWAWEVYTDHWWSYEPDKGLLFYGKSPQCNTNEWISKKITEQCHPGAEVLFVPRVYLPHNCGDYV